MKTGVICGVACFGAFALAMPILLNRDGASPRPRKDAEEAPAIVEEVQPTPKASAKPTSQPSPSSAPTSAAEVKKKDVEPIRLEAPKKDGVSGQKIYETVLNSTVWINNPGFGFGSGALINAADKLVLTNYHVVFRRTAAQPGKVAHVMQNALNATDARDKNTKLPYKIFEYQFSRQYGYIIDMESKEVDSVLQIRDLKDNVLVTDDDSGGGLNAQIYFIPPEDGKYRIVATEFAQAFGSFTLKISKVDFKGRGPTAAAGVASYLFVNFPEAIKGKVVPDKSYYQGLVSLDRDKYKAKVVAYSEAKDLAVLQLNHLPEGAVPLPLAKDSSQPGQLVHSIGNPGDSGALWVYTSGTVRTAPYQKTWTSTGTGGRMKHDAVVIETQSPTNPGDSGGPLINENIELVAVTQGGSLYGNSISLFVDVQDVRNFLKSKGLRWVER
jgi:S1-C subfamily serine protease